MDVHPWAQELADLAIEHHGVTPGPNRIVKHPGDVSDDGYKWVSVSIPISNEFLKVMAEGTKFTLRRMATEARIFSRLARDLEELGISDPN